MAVPRVLAGEMMAEMNKRTLGLVSLRFVSRQRRDFYVKQQVRLYLCELLVSSLVKCLALYC